MCDSFFGYLKKFDSGTLKVKTEKILSTFSVTFLKRRNIHNFSSSDVIFIILL